MYYYTTTETLNSIAQAIQSRYRDDTGLAFPLDFMFNASRFNSLAEIEYLEGTLTRAVDTDGVITEIPLYAFQMMESLSVASFASCVRIWDSAFQQCSNLTEISFPMCSYIGGNAFAFTNIRSVYFPECSYIGYYAFGSCPELTHVNFPKCTSTADTLFARCSKLVSVEMPLCSTIVASMFAYCYSLKTLSFPNCTSIARFAFMSTSVDSVYLLGSSIPTLSASSVFYSAKIPRFYVPSSMVDAYKSASVWRNYSTYIYGI